MNIQQANFVKQQYNAGVITREQAKEQLKPFINLYNSKSIELAKKYGQKPKQFGFAGFMR